MAMNKLYRILGKRYRFSPYYLVWNEDHYYAVGYSEKHQKITTFRVDRMKGINILSVVAVEKPDNFSLPEFTRQVFDMYDGTKEKVIIAYQIQFVNTREPFFVFHTELLL